MWILVSSQPARNASTPGADDGVAEPAEGFAEVRIGDPGEPFVERGNLTDGKCSRGPLPQRRIERYWSLHQRQAANDGSAKKEVDALDQQGRAML